MARAELWGTREDVLTSSRWEVGDSRAQALHLFLPQRWNLEKDLAGRGPPAGWTRPQGFRLRGSVGTLGGVGAQRVEKDPRALLWRKSSNPGLFQRLAKLSPVSPLQSAEFRYPPVTVGACVQGGRVAHKLRGFGLWWLGTLKSVRITYRRPV